MLAIIQKKIVSYLLAYGGQLLMDLWKHFLRSQEQRKALDHVEKVAADPQSSAKEIGEAYANAINAGRN